MLAFADTGGAKAASLFGGMVLYVAIALGLLAFSALAVAFFQSRLEEAALNAQKRGPRGMWMGLFIYGLLLAALAVAGNLQVLKPIVGILILILLGLSLMAFTAAAQEVGQRISLMREHSTPLSTILSGCLILELAFLLPILGQILWVILLARGLGAWVATLRRPSNGVSP